MSLFGVLGVAFIVLKLCGVITWSWWWVTCPFWGGFIFSIFWTFVYVYLTKWLNKNDPLWQYEKYLKK